MLNPGKEMTYTVQRGSSVLKKTLKLAQTKDEAAGYSGIFLPGMEPLVGAVQTKSPAEKAGLKADDKILAIDGQPIHYWHEMTGYIQASKGNALAFEIQRGTQKQAYSISPEYLENEKRYIVGIEQKIPEVFVRYGFGEGLKAGFGDAYYWAGLTVRIIGKLFSGQVSPKAMSGPLGIAALAGQAWRAGISRFIVLIVIISVNLGILNLIPIPPLDGSHILIVIIEGVTRRTVPKQVKEGIFTFFFFLLIGFMVYVTFNDVTRLKEPITNWFQQFQKSPKEK
jgi:regulator of sigma E protease